MQLGLISVGDGSWEGGFLKFLMGFHLKRDFKGVGILWMGVEGSGIQ